MKKTIVFACFLSISFWGCKKEASTQNGISTLNGGVLSPLKTISSDDADASITLMDSRGYSAINGQSFDDAYLQCVLSPHSLNAFAWNGIPTERQQEGSVFYKRLSSDSVAGVFGVAGNFSGNGGNFPAFSIPFQAPKQMELSFTGINATNNVATIPVGGSVKLSWVPDANAAGKPVVIMGINDETVQTPRQIQKIVSESTGSVTFTSGDLQTLGGVGAVVYFVVGRGNEAEEMVEGKKIYILAVSYAWTSMATIE